MSVAPRRSDQRSAFLRHPSVQRLLAEEAPIQCPRLAIRQRVSRLAAETTALGWDGPPFDMEVLASLQGMQVRVVDWLDGNQDGFLLPGRPPRIHLSCHLPPTRARYTVAHEIVHTLLPGVRQTEGERHWVYRYDAQSPVEQLCQVGASELLMPSALVADVLAGRAESLEVAEEVRKTFNVSLEAAVRNLVDLASGGCALVVLQLMNKPSELTADSQPSLPGLDLSPPEKRLRVLYSWTSRAWDHHYFPQHKSVPDNSVAYEALGADESLPEVAGAAEDWEGIGGVRWCHVQAVRVWREAEPTVLCLLRALASDHGD